MAGALSGKTAVVTGASSGIGAAIAACLAEEGVQLHLIGRNQSGLSAIAQAAQKSSPRVLTYQADLSADEGLEQLAASLNKDCDRADILVHSAGIIITAPIEQASREDFDRQYRTNVRAPFVLTQALLPKLRRDRGAIVFINSSAGLTTRANISQYSATKFALKAVADSLRAEVNEHGVRVLSIYPGRTASPQQAAIHKAEGKEYRPELLMQPADVARIVVDALKVNTTAEVTDIQIRPMRKS
ncbi:MAG TPA: SDR family oxidoreductase [Candidatus Dormibacteraeota bacterium]|nr:SDR family oxidoreductase [Candidatus Dormibacteraeota bacterium]